LRRGKRKGATIALGPEQGRSPPEAASWRPPGPQHAPAAVIGPLEGPQLVWLSLRPPYYVYVLALTLLDLGNRRRPRLDVISTSDVRRWLRLRRGNWRGLEKVIRNAVRWGLLSPATRRGRAWRGHYVVNWDNVRYVASLVPMNPGDRRLNNDYKRGFGAFRLALEVISDFRAALRGTRVQARGFWPLGGVPEGSVTGVTGLTQLRRLRLSLISLGPIVLPALVLGGGTIYFVPMGVGGGAKSRFPCLAYPSGKYLCAGSVKALNELMELAGGVPPEPLPYGGAAARLVVDLPPNGLQPYDLAPGLAPKLEPGVQLYDSALQSCLSRWHVLLTTRYRLPSGFEGWPSLVMLPQGGRRRGALPYSPASRGGT